MELPPDARPEENFASVGRELKEMKGQTDFPDHCRTRFETRVRFFETDLMGIVHHATYLTYVEAARVEYLRRRGADYRELVARGLHMPVVEAHLKYRKTARFDDVLCVEVRLGGLTRVTVRFDYVLFKPDSERDRVADGYTLLACVGDDHRPRRIPTEVAEMLKSPESPSFVR